MTHIRSKVHQPPPNIRYTASCPAHPPCFKPCAGTPCGNLARDCPSTPILPRSCAARAWSISRGKRIARLGQCSILGDMSLSAFCPHQAPSIPGKFTKTLESQKSVSLTPSGDSDRRRNLPAAQYPRGRDAWARPPAEDSWRRECPRGTQRWESVSCEDEVTPGHSSPFRGCGRCLLTGPH